MENWFWLILCSLTIIWYVVVTAIVAFRGANDIKEMIGTMAEKQDDKDE